LVYARITALLKDKTGLDVASIAVGCVERAVRERLAARGLGDLEVYWEQLCASDRELQELIEAVVIPETWFFRDSEAFAALVRVVREEWLAKHVEGAVRALSLPCSTGEEPFSMAMALLDGGLPPTRFHIDAVDISTRAIERAERGIYGKNSFRAKDLDFRDRYFEPVERGHRLREVVRGQVTFRHGNLLTAGRLHSARAYDVIFCRNLLIYFDRATQCRAIEALGRLMTPSALLFVGAAEAPLLLDQGFLPSGMPLAFAYRQAASSAPQPPQARRRRIPDAAVVAAQPVDRRARRPSPIADPQPKPIAVDTAIAVAEHWIERARRFANQGKLVEALTCCEHNLHSEPPSAEIFHLVGLLHDAAGRVHEAAEHYRKALYLDPRHPEALVHLAVALQREGDARGAQRMFERANRHAGAGETKGGG
jgi:chemotaxis protein methyltransferase WspC